MPPLEVVCLHRSTSTRAVPQGAKSCSPSRLASVLLGLSPVAQPHEMISELRPKKGAPMLVRLSIIGAVTALLMVPDTLSAQGVGGTVNTSVSRGIPTAADLERSSRSANKYRSLHKHTTPRSRVADRDPCVNGSRDRRASPTRHIEDNRIRRYASGLGCDRPARATPVASGRRRGASAFLHAHRLAARTSWQ